MDLLILVHYLGSCTIGNMVITLFPNSRKAHPGILQEPHFALRNRAAEVSTISDAVRDIASKLCVTLDDLDTVLNPWLGLSAPQLGVPLRVVAIKNGLRYHSYTVLVNPVILKQALM